MATNSLQILKKGKRPAPSETSEDEDEIYNDGKNCVPICVISAVPHFTQVVYVI